MTLREIFMLIFKRDSETSYCAVISLLCQMNLSQLRDCRDYLDGYINLRERAAKPATEGEK